MVVDSRKLGFHWNQQRITSPGKINYTKKNIFTQINGKIMQKLIRDKIARQLPFNEVREITHIPTLNGLYSLKVIEELKEIERSNFRDVEEFGDLITVVVDFAKLNGFGENIIGPTIDRKVREKGRFTNKVLTNLNPTNPSNAIYLTKTKHWSFKLLWFRFSIEF